MNRNRNARWLNDLAAEETRRARAIASRTRLRQRGILPVTEAIRAGLLPPGYRNGEEPA